MTRSDTLKLSKSSPYLGTTILELLLIAVIISLVAVGSSVNYVAQRQKQVLLTTSEKIKSTIEQARTDAVNGKYYSNTIVKVTNGSNPILYIGPDKQPNGDPITISSGNGYKLPSGITLKGPPQEIMFTQISGRPDVPPNYQDGNFNNGIILNNGSFKINVWVSSEGVITISPPYK